MAKKFVRGITDIKTINNQDFDTNNVNDLLSDGEHNYIHRKKKDKSEEYHNLTNNIKTIKSDNTDLLAVTNNNNTTNSATLHPKHDAQKEQVLASTRNTITIEHGDNGTSETTKVDTNPEKVLEHENLLTDYGISKTTTGNTTKIGIEYTKVPDGFDLNSLTSGNVRGTNLLNSPTPNAWFFIQALKQANDTLQYAVNLVDEHNASYVRRRDSGVWGPWRELVGDKSVIDALLAQKQNKLTAGEGITIQDNVISSSGDGGLFPIFLEYGTRGESYYVFMEGFGLRTTFTIEVVQGSTEFTVDGALKTELTQHLTSLGTVTNGAITLTYDGTNVKIINNNPSLETTQQATFTFYTKPSVPEGPAS